MANTASLRRLNIPLSLIAILLLLPLGALAAPNPDPRFENSRDINLFLGRAKEAESQGDWKYAYAYYDYILTIDRNHAEAKRGLNFALRNLHRQFRHSDPSFRHQLLGARFSESVEFYKDVVSKVREFYLEPERVQIQRLFQEGVEELHLALQDYEFRKLYLPQSRPDLIDEFCVQLKSTWAPLRVGSLTESADKTVAVAREAGRRLGINPRVVIVEMACGAVNALDEHSFYLTTGSLMGEAGPSIGQVKLHEGGVGYIELLNFQDNTFTDLEAALGQLSMTGMKVLVLDLRNNPGGSLKAAIQVAERFLNAPLPIATTSGKVNDVFHSFNMEAFDLPIFVLIDGNTASSAELVAGALKSHQRAELVGQTTFGKNQIQKLLHLGQAPAGAIRITWAQFYLPRTHDLSKQGGITPTIPESDPDRQLEVALQRARMLIR